MWRPDKQDLIHLCRELLRRAGISGREGDVARFVSESMRSLGYDSVTVDSYGSVLGRITFPGEGERALFTAQMDHVDAGDTAEWTRYPFGADLEGGRIYGRGASDQKGALAGMILAGAMLKAEGGAGLSGSVTVAAAVHQETFEGVASRSIGEAVNPSCVIVGEASALIIERGQRGRAEIQIDTFGTMAHSSHPELGVNAADTMMEFLSFLRRSFRPPKHDFLGDGILVLTGLYTAPLHNSGTLPERCTAIFDRRLLPGETCGEVLEKIAMIAEEAMSSIPGLKTKVSIPVRHDRCYTGAPIKGSLYAPGWEVPKESPFLHTLSSSLAAAQLPSSISPEPGFGTNGCYYGAERGIPTAIYGPSRRELVHRIDEYIEVEDLVSACRGYYSMMRGLLKKKTEEGEMVHGTGD